MMIVTLSSPLGQLVLGGVMEDVGPRQTMLGAGAVMAAVSLVFVVSGRLRYLDADS